MEFTKFWGEVKNGPSLGLSKNKKAFSFRGDLPRWPRPGALPLDPNGGTAPRPPTIPPAPNLPLHHCPRWFVPWTIRTMIDYSRLGLFITSLEYSYNGPFVPSLDFLYHWWFILWAVHISAQWLFLGIIYNFRTLCLNIISWVLAWLLYIKFGQDYRIGTLPVLTSVLLIQRIQVLFRHGSLFQYMHSFAVKGSSKMNTQQKDWSLMGAA